MIETSAAFAALLDTKPLRLRLTLPDGIQVGDITPADPASKPAIKKAEWSGGSNAGDDITLGSTVAQQLKVEFDREALSGLELSDQMITAELTIDGADDVLPVAKVRVTNVDSSDDTVTVTACDAMAWAFNGLYALDDAALGFDWSAGVDGEALLQAICRVCGVPLTTTGLPAVTLKLVDAAGYTYREVIAFLACLWGRFARIDGRGRLVLQWYAAADRPIGPDRYYDGELTKADYMYTVGYLKCYVEPLEETLEAGDTSKAQGIYIKCPWMTPERLEAVWAAIGGFCYRPVSDLRFLGDPRLEPGDVLQVTDRDGAVHAVPCMTLRHEFDGGLISEITAVGKSESASSLDYQGPVSKMIERAVQGVKASIIKYQDRIEMRVSQSETTAQEAKDAVDNLSVGGRNYALGTKLCDDLLYAASRPAIVTEEDGYGVLRAEGTGSSYVGPSFKLSARHIYDPKSACVANELAGKTVTVSFDTRANVAKGPYSLFLGLRGYTQAGSAIRVMYKTIARAADVAAFYPAGSAEVWRRVSLTFRVPEETEEWSADTGFGETYDREWMVIGFTPQTSLAAGEWFEVSRFKLNEGAVPTDWTPAPEDVEEQISDARSELQETLRETSSALVATAEGLILSALASYVQTGSFEEFRTSVEASLSVLSDQLTIKFTETMEQITNVDGDMQSRFEEYSKYFRFTADGLEIGEEGNALLLRLDNDMIEFLQNGKRVSYWDGNNFHTGNLIFDVTERAQFGSFAFVPRSDGSMSLLKMG